MRLAWSLARFTRTTTCIDSLVQHCHQVSTKAPKAAHRFLSPPPPPFALPNGENSKSQEAPYVPAPATPPPQQDARSHHDEAEGEVPHLTRPPEVTVHSRAARRASSPSLNLDKSAKPAAHTSRDSASPSRPSKLNPHALAAKDAGIIKKQKKGNLTRAQRLRQQKGLERAADNMDKLEVKRSKSFVREKKVKERAKGWEDVNDDGSKAPRKKVKKDAEMGLENAGGWMDEDMEEADAVAVVRNADVQADGKDVDAVVHSSTAMPVGEDELL
ncbi:hypothetical protein J1614_003055 [Plenodomus biglobosus]|nr:hypothetical protein J1614_003055 [Plenodomus biglobosus]